MKFKVKQLIYVLFAPLYDQKFFFFLKKIGWDLLLYAKIALYVSLGCQDHTQCIRIA